MEGKEISTCRGLMSLSPIFVFMAMYLVVSLIVGDFYRMPLTVAFIAASIWAVISNTGRTLNERLEIFSKGAGQHNIIYMIWIFILAGAFATLVKESGAIEATVNIAIRFLPHELLIPGIFLVACFISFSIGTSVGTVVALTPLAVNIAANCGVSEALFVAAVLGGAFFGDNLSFISDTTIAATRTQGVAMKAKFKTNLLLVIPAAIATLAIYAVLGSKVDYHPFIADTNPLLVLPYMLVIVLSVMGLNVTVVLLGGILSATVIALSEGHDIMELCGYMGNGIDSMGDLIIITLLSAGMLATIKSTGGIDFLLQRMTNHVEGARGAKAVIVALVASVNVCTANNTVAIITVGSLARKISEKYRIGGARTASLLDTGSCIMQCLLPYGAQTLLATGMASIGPLDPWPYLYYPWALSIAVIVSVVMLRKQSRKYNFV